MSNTIPRAPQRNRQFWLDHVEKWKTSGLSKAAYCQMSSISVGNFYNWSGPARSGKKQTTATTKCAKSDTRNENCLTFVPVTIKTSERNSTMSLIHVERASTSVQLPSDLSPEQIQSWLSAIHQLHV